MAGGGIYFATSVIPGWHTTIFPPYFVAGAIFSGFAMVQSLMIILQSKPSRQARKPSYGSSDFKPVISLIRSITSICSGVQESKDIDLTLEI